MKNIFASQYGSIYTGKEIKEFLNDWKSKGNSMYKLYQYLNCKDESKYMYTLLPGTTPESDYKGFVKVDWE